jgi:CheY-like chemotaxis protein
LWLKVSISPRNIVDSALTATDNPVNQQIALKFIKALKFSVTAVWNGKEALEYLLKATAPDLTPEQAAEFPIPSLILMDVQMPILDGYHATHILRHHAPFREMEVLSKIPIVAMTASAIQGDREKCEKAGMDDYMAKPVKRSLLENTVLKWVARGRNNKSRKPSQSAANAQKPVLDRVSTEHSSTCEQNDAIAAELLSQYRKSHVPVAVSDGETPTDLEMQTQAAARRSSISRAIREFEIPGQESEAARADRRAADVDKARALRDAKLMTATGLDNGVPFRMPQASRDGNDSTIHLATSPGATSVTTMSSMALTEANVSLLNHEQGTISPVSPDESPAMQSDEMAYPVSDIPGPPPEHLMAAIDLARIDASAEELVSNILENAQIPPSTPVSEDQSRPKLSPPSSGHRRKVGGLNNDNRKVSDWSVSTARPDKG